MIKYRINCSLNIIGGKPRIYISAKSISLLSSIVKAYMTKDMYYKLESGKSKLEIERSTNTSLGGYLDFKTISKVSQKKVGTSSMARFIYIYMSVRTHRTNIQKRTFSRTKKY